MMGLAGRYTVSPSPLNEEELQIELANKNFSPQEYARTLAERKAHAMGVMMCGTVPNSGEVTIIIGSDTIVDLDGTISEFIGLPPNFFDL
jgi:predicted house-cleaning NTP pyrophosphatase (Maf/HAM1 superfamily)